MNLNDATLWWLLTGCCVALELLSGTFYLLMLASGLAAGALAAHAGAELSWQISIAALVGGGAVLVWHRIRSAGGPPPSDAANPDLHLDVGETLMVEQWLPDGSARVKYRGSHWTAIHRPGLPPEPGLYRVAEVVGNRLLLDKV